MTDGSSSSVEIPVGSVPQEDSRTPPSSDYNKLPYLQELSRAGLPKPLVRLAGVFTNDLKRNLQQTGEFALKAFRTDLRVEGKPHSGSTIFVLNHPLWVEDLFFLTTALGDKTKNLKVIVTQELFLVIPPKLRHHFIPVDTGLHERRAKLKGLEKVVTDVLHKALPNSPLREAGKRNQGALQVAAAHVANGGDVAIFEERNVGDIVRRSDAGKLWFSGVGSLVERTRELMPERKDAYVQMMAIEFVEGNKMNPLAHKSVDLTIAEPIPVNSLTVGLGTMRRKAPARKIITERLQSAWTNAFRYKTDPLLTPDVVKQNI